MGCPAVLRLQQEVSERTVCQRFKGGCDAILFDDVRPSGHTVGVSPNDGVRVLDCTMVLGIFRTDDNIVCLERGRCVVR